MNELVHHPIPPIPSNIPAFNILFISEGYTSGLEFEFQGQAISIFQEFLEIDPFTCFRDKIAGWTLFIPSTVADITEEERETAFRFQYDSNYGLMTKYPHLIYDAIQEKEKEKEFRKYKIPNLEYKDDTQEFSRGADLWKNNLNDHKGVICILARSEDKRAFTHLKWIEDEAISHSDPSTIRNEANLWLPWVYLSSWLLYGDNCIENFNKDKARPVANLFARQVALTFSLSEETEKDGGSFKTYLEDEPEEFNITKRETFCSSPNSFNINQIKWVKLISKIDENPDIFELEHPTDDSFDAYKTLADKAVLSILMLKHPNSAEINIDRYNLPPKNQILLPGEVNLFEGGGGYRQNIYRPSAECKLRFDSYEENTKFIPVDFCPVCYKQIRDSLNGTGEYEIGTVKIIPSFVPFGNKIESRLADVFISYILSTNCFSYDNGYLQCVEATARRFECFFRDVLKWPHNKTQEIKFKDPDESGWKSPKPSCNDMWNVKNLIFPTNNNKDANKAWAIWMTRLGGNACSPENDTSIYALSNWRDKKEALSYAGLGAPGSIVYSGFGGLANQCSRKYLNNDLAFPYLDIQNLYMNEEVDKYKNFRCLKPGSILQAWKSHNQYLSLKKYVAGINSSVSDCLGHSLYFMGIENEDVFIADQYYNIGSISGWIDDGFKFWIAAQWFDAKNIKR